MAASQQSPQKKVSCHLGATFHTTSIFEKHLQRYQKTPGKQQQQPTPFQQYSTKTTCDSHFHLDHKNSRRDDTFQFLLVILSLVSMSLFSTSHRKIFILAGIFPFQMFLNAGPPSLMVRALYMQFSQKIYAYCPISTQFYLVPNINKGNKIVSSTIFYLVTP